MLSFINAVLALRSSGYPLHPPPPVRTTAVRPAPAAVEQAAALASISAAALGGAAISETLTPSSFDMLASAGLFNEDVLYTDWMMDKIDALSPACWLVAAALVAGNFAAPLMAVVAIAVAQGVARRGRGDAGPARGGLGLRARRGPGLRLRRHLL